MRVELCRFAKQIADSFWFILVRQKLVNKFADLLAIPLTRIFNYSLYLEQWPECWKIETVTAIPKNNSPTNFGELRNISCTNLFSKVLEHFVLQRLRREIGPRTNQFGGLPGSGVNHYLTAAWNSVAEALEEDDQTAMNLISVDFAKAFNTMSHGACVNAFANKGASRHSVGMVSAFLRGRRMRFKVGRSFSTCRPIKGGSALSWNQ